MTGEGAFVYGMAGDVFNDRHAGIFAAIGMVL
jgi:hypothetical protein